MSRRLAPWLLPPAVHGLLAGLSAAATALLACSPASSPDAPAASEAPSAVAVAPRASTAAAATTPAPAATPVAPVASASAAPVASASSGATEPTPTPSPVATTGPVPNVKVANIGIHIGGGPNDAVTKEPFKKSVFPHHDELRRCWGAHGDGQTGDISVELKVEREGGKARVRPNRSTFKNKDFNACVITVLEGIDFLKPRTGTTVLNYSIRFTPEK